MLVHNMLHSLDCDSTVGLNNYSCIKTQEEQEYIHIMNPSMGAAYYNLSLH